MFLLGTALGRELLFGVTQAIVRESQDGLAAEVEVSSPDTNSPTPSDTITLTLTLAPEESEEESETDSTDNNEIQVSVTLTPENVLPAQTSTTPTPEITATPSVLPKPSNTPASNAASPTQIPSVTVTLTSTPTSNPTASPTPSVAAKLLVAPAYLEPLFNQYAAQYNVDGQLLRKIANCESHYNTGVVGGGGLYGGMFQFGVESWQSMRNKMGLDPNPDLRFGANESIQTAAYALSLGKASMWPSCSK